MSSKLVADTVGFCGNERKQEKVPDYYGLSIVVFFNLKAMYFHS